MAVVSDNWYIRLPDGRIVLAKSTRAVRHHLQTGRIPANSKIRRNVAEEWQKLDVIPEFASLLEQPASRDLPVPERNTDTAIPTRGADFRALGAGGLVGELLNAVDSSLNGYKLRVAGLASLSWAIGILSIDLLAHIGDPLHALIYRATIGLVLLFIAGLASAILGQMTLVEMSRFRPARWKEIRPGLLGKALKIMIGQTLILAVVLVPMIALRNGPERWFGIDQPPPVVLGVLLVLRLVLEVVLWPLVGMSLLFGPLMLVEECTLPSALAQWWDMLRSDLGRIFLYETLAGALGIVLTFPLTLPVLYASWSIGPVSFDLQSAVGLPTVYVLGGLAMTPLVSFLLVANVFIYLNLRYEFLFPNSR